LDGYGRATANVCGPRTCLKGVEDLLLHSSRFVAKLGINERNYKIDTLDFHMKRNRSAIL